MINLTKGQAVSLSKGTGNVRLRCAWSSRTDYDLFALVLYADGRVETVATFGAETKPRRTSRAVDPKEQTSDGAVTHRGDIQGDGNQDEAEEIVDITLNSSIRAIVPVVYSAQLNGTGSFYRYMVSMEVAAGSETVRIDANDAENDDRVYSCVPGVIEQMDGAVHVRRLDYYSKRNSENRPIVRLNSSDQIEVIMDNGPRNDDKRI